VNKDLVSVIGNFVSRIIKFAISRFDAKAFPTTRSKRGRAVQRSGHGGGRADAAEGRVIRTGRSESTRG
jgi:hypothetical protein